MGHSSVAEHAVFNFDIIDLSRLAIEELEKFRLASYTEKSQRYQKLEDNCYIPAELASSEFAGPIADLTEKQNRLYQALLGRGVEPEDARYVTPLSTMGQLGMTVNARTLELMIRRFASSQLAEVRGLGKELLALAAKVAPSLIRYTEATNYESRTSADLQKFFKGKWERKRFRSQPCVLVDYTKDADIKLVSALLHSSSTISYLNCRRQVKGMSRLEREKAVKQACRHLNFFNAVLREFEHVTLTFDLVMSAGCFAQLKRHRPLTLTTQPYEPLLGVTLPARLVGDNEVEALIKKTNDLFSKIVTHFPAAAPYVLTGAHRRRALLTINARELYHLSRLREDAHAQWDINELSGAMTKMAKEVMPLTMLMVGGKDSFVQRYQSVYGGGGE
ncbi:MAG: FAD-dependent thymidylate synthase [Candidatus Margulisbacteria bacterium]|nr:FAD-dependent thymidylate synthase [Candidatus Margulisiibacteriota bacterium]